MENCLYFRTLAALRPDGELTETELAELEQHMEQCPDCRDAAAAYDAMFALHRDEWAEAPDTLTPSILTAIKQHRKKRRFPLYPMMAAAACLALLLVIKPWTLPTAQSDSHPFSAVSPAMLVAPESKTAELHGSEDPGIAITDANMISVSADEAETLLAQSEGYTQALVIRSDLLEEGALEKTTGTHSSGPAPTSAFSEPNVPPNETNASAEPESGESDMAAYLFLTDETELLRYTDLYGGELLDGEAEVELYLVVFLP